jgi:parvulin-like peptidyl-prolyl isomerase
MKNNLIRLHPIIKTSLLFLFLVVAIPLHAETAPVIGTVGDIQITAPELRESIAGIDGGREASLVKNPAAIGQYARALLLQRLVLKQALDAKWDQKPDVISKLVQVRESALTESYLEAHSAPAADFPSESELSQAYDANKAKLVIPQAYEIAQIYISSPENADEKSQHAAKDKLEVVIKELSTKGVDFAAVARKSSEENVSANQGGKIGWLTESQIQPELRAKLPKLKLGIVSDPIRLSDGWHILKVLDVREARTPVLAEIRDKIVSKLREEKAHAIRQDFIAALLKEHPMAINEIELSKLFVKP